jgi:hypothetical protein
MPCSGGHPEWHYECDIRFVLDDPWDLVIAFPPCTHLAVSGSKHFANKRKSGVQQAGIDFFMIFTKLKCRWAIEQPIGIMSTIYRKPDQIIQPWQFGHKASKKTCLWLNGLPPLTPTNIVGPPPSYAKMTKQELKEWTAVHRCPPGPYRSRIRSTTYSGIGMAMAAQWQNEHPVNQKTLF